MITVSDPVSQTISFGNIGKELLNYVRWKITLLTYFKWKPCIDLLSVSLLLFSVFLLHGRACACVCKGCFSAVSFKHM